MSTYFRIIVLKFQLSAPYQTEAAAFLALLELSLALHINIVSSRWLLAGNSLNCEVFPCAMQWLVKYSGSGNLNNKVKIAVILRTGTQHYLCKVRHHITW